MPGSDGLACRFIVYDGNWSWLLAISDDHVRLVTGATVAVDTTAFHDYRMLTRPDGTAQLFIDGVLRDTKTGNASTTNALAFGDVTSTGENADFELTRFQLTQSDVPEPASIALLGIGGLAVTRRRR